MLNFTQAIEEITDAAVDPAIVKAWLEEHAPEIAAAMAKDLTVGDVHVTTALPGKAKTFLQTKQELEDGAKVVDVPDSFTKDAPPVLKPIDDKTSHSPFPHDAGALGNLRADQVPRFLGALTDQDRLPSKSVSMASLVAMQNRVDTGKVQAMRESKPEKPALVVRANGRNLIADGHHRLAADYLGGAKSAKVKYLDISAEDNALKHDSLEAAFKVAKVEGDRQHVFGWASVTHIDGQMIIDKQGDAISSDELESGVYDYMLKARQQGNMHEVTTDIGQCIESVVFTLEKFENCGLAAFDPQTGDQIFGWWVGFHTTDSAVWKQIKEGLLPEFSIGGKATRVPLS